MPEKADFTMAGKNDSVKTTEIQAPKGVSFNETELKLIENEAKLNFGKGFNGSRTTAMLDRVMSGVRPEILAVFGRARGAALTSVRTALRASDSTLVEPTDYPKSAGDYVARVTQALTTTLAGIQAGDPIPTSLPRPARVARSY